VKIHRGGSLDIASQFADRYFDVIYIDADHHYDAVLADLFAYAPKLKSGGILWGDDFLEDLSRTDGLYGTIDAVNTFLKRTDFKCLAILGCSECQYVLYREMSAYVDGFLARLLDEGRDIVEVNNALLSRFTQRLIKTSAKSGYKSRTVPSFV
jgi:cephalosporin hydroxylase